MISFLFFGSAFWQDRIHIGLPGHHPLLWVILAQQHEKNTAHETL